MNGIFDWGDDSDDDDSYDIKNCRKCSKMNIGGKNMVCSRCKKVSYCSKECQCADWSKHKKACKHLQQEGKFVKKVKDYYQSDTMKQTLEEIKQKFDPQEMLSRGIDINAFNTEAGQSKLKDLSEAMSASDQLDSVLNKYKDVEPQKLAHKLLKAIHDSHDRRAFHLEVYQYMMQKPKVWDACFETKKSKDSFFFVLRIVMKNDIHEYNSLEDGLSDRIIPSASDYIIPNLHFTPLVQQEMTRSEFYAENRKCMMPGYQQQGVAMKLETDHISWYFKTCWKEHVELSLAMLTAYQKGITNLMEDILIHWKYTVHSLVNPETVRQLFQSSLDLYNKPFHDPQSPCMIALIDMLRVRGPGVGQFKHWVYQAAAFLLVQAQFSIQGENLILPHLFQMALIDKLGEQQLNFFVHASDFSQVIMSAASTRPDVPVDAPRILEPIYERFFAENPKVKDVL